jgi:hypothetical protein
MARRPKPEIFEFPQTVHEGGYELRAGHFMLGLDPQEHEGPALIAIGTAVRGFHPSRELFLEFASTDPDDDVAIVGFANANGLLTLGYLTPVPAEGQSSQSEIGELLSFWRGHIGLMNEAVTLWQLLKRQDQEALARRIRWDGADCVRYDSPRGKSIIASRNPDIRAFLFDRLKPGDAMMPARLYLQELVNENLRRRVHPKLLWTADRTHMVRFDVPDGLLGYMWDCFAGAVAEHQAFRHCLICGRPMTSSDKGFRANRTTCSDACRAKLYEARVAQAQKLAGQGVEPKRIAEQLGTNVGRVRSWMKRGKTKP